MTSKSEKKSTSREKLGFGMKYTLAVVISILAICALYFIYVSVATHFSPPLQPMFDQERLGQLGDFLGGTLNPIFGFTTVCLLLWSVFIQRKELSLTRDELKKSAAALTDQVKLATDEYNRKQLDAFLDSLERNYQNLVQEKKLPTYITTDTHPIKVDSVEKLISGLQKYPLARINPSIKDIIENNKLDFDAKIHLEKIEKLVQDIMQIISEIKLLTKSEAAIYQLYQKEMDYKKFIALLQITSEHPS